MITFGVGHSSNKVARGSGGDLTKQAFTIKLRLQERGDRIGGKHWSDADARDIE